MKPDSQDGFQRLLTFTERLKRAKIHQRLDQVRAEGIMVQIAVPRERWKVEFMVDGSAEVERFHSNGQLAGSAAFEELFARFSDTGDSGGPHRTAILSFKWRLFSQPKIGSRSPAQPTSGWCPRLTNRWRASTACAGRSRSPCCFVALNPSNRL